MGYRWAIRFCERAKYVVKINDDNFVDTVEIINNFIPMMEKKKGSFICSSREGNLSTTNTVAEGSVKNNSNPIIVKYCAGDAYLV